MGVVQSFMRRGLMTGLASAALLGASVGAQVTTDGDLDVPYVQTPDVVVEAMLDLAQVQPGETVIDLGSGDGRLLIEAARRGGQGFGVDIDPRLVELANRNARLAGVADRAEFRNQDLFDTDLSSADVLTVYLLPAVNAKLVPTVLALEPGTRIVSHDYGFGDWPPHQKITVDAPDKPVNALKVSDLLLYIVPAPVAGRWQGQNELGEFTFDLEQSFQHLNGELRVNSQSSLPAKGELTGREIELTTGAGVTGVRFSGRVHPDDADRMEGQVEERGRQASLTLRRVANR